jgi:hypothetical protein
MTSSRSSRQREKDVPSPSSKARRSSTAGSGLLSREAFGEAVFARDKHRCVFCSAPAVDAHHLIERKLFPDGGYYVDNGISVCSEHHMACERTDLSVEEGRAAAGIVCVMVPAGFDPAVSVDKWGNVVHPDGTRSPGPMFGLENVEKVMRHHFWRFEPKAEVSDGPT